MTAAQISTTQNTEKTLSFPRILVHLEGFAVLIASLYLYSRFAITGWGIFFLLLLTPDLVFIIYMMNKHAGIAVYNIVHTYTAPIILGILALVTGWQLGLALALIWLAHNSMDRTVGYGLKYNTQFNDTHIGRL